MTDDLVRVCNNTDRTWLSGRMPEPYTESDAEEWLAHVASREGRDALFRVIVVDGTVAGDISVEKDEDTGGWEVGYLLSRPFFGKGIATAALRDMCDIAFGFIDGDTIFARVYSSNIASRRVLEKNGFVQGRAVAKTAPVGRVVACEYVYTKTRPE